LQHAAYENTLIFKLLRVILFLFASPVVQAAILKCLDSARHTAGTSANT